MARVTVEDCIDKVENRFDLVLISSHRPRMISSGALPAHGAVKKLAPSSVSSTWRDLPDLLCHTLTCLVSGLKSATVRRASSP